MSMEDEVRRVVAGALDPAIEELRSATATLRSEISRGAQEYLTTHEAAELARVTPATIREWIKNGKLHRYGLGRGLLVRTAEVHQLLAPEAGDPIDRAVEAELQTLRLSGGE